jgi:hypothetical protein
MVGTSITVLGTMIGTSGSILSICFGENMDMLMSCITITSSLIENVAGLLAA